MSCSTASTRPPADRARDAASTTAAVQPSVAARSRSASAADTGSPKPSWHSARTSSAVMARSAEPSQAAEPSRRSGSSAGGASRPISSSRWPLASWPAIRVSSDTASGSAFWISSTTTTAGCAAIDSSIASMTPAGPAADACSIRAAMSDRPTRAAADRSRSGSMPAETPPGSSAVITAATPRWSQASAARIDLP